MQSKEPARLEYRDMSSPAAEARLLIGDIRQSYPAGTPWKVVAAETARRVKITERRVLAFWNREVRKPLAEEMDRLRVYAATRCRRNEEAARDEHRNIVERISAIEQRLGAIDPDFHRETVDALRMARGDRSGVVGGADSALDQE